MLPRLLILNLEEADGEFTRQAYALAGTHPGTKTVRRTVLVLRIALFESLII